MSDCNHQFFKYADIQLIPERVVCAVCGQVRDLNPYGYEIRSKEYLVQEKAAFKRVYQSGELILKTEKESND